MSLSLKELTHELLAAYTELHRFLSHHLDNPHEAADVAQASFERVYAHALGRAGGQPQSVRRGRDDTAPSPRDPASPHDPATGQGAADPAPVYAGLDSAADIRPVSLSGLGADVARGPRTAVPGGTRSSGG